MNSTKRRKKQLISSGTYTRWLTPETTGLECHFLSPAWRSRSQRKRKNDRALLVVFFLFFVYLILSPLMYFKNGFFECVKFIYTVVNRVESKKNSISSFPFWVLVFRMGWLSLFLYKTSMIGLINHTTVKSFGFAWFLCIFNLRFRKLFLCVTWILIILSELITVFEVIRHNLQSFGVLSAIFSLFTLPSWFRLVEHFLRL